MSSFVSLYFFPNFLPFLVSSANKVQSSDEVCSTTTTDQNDLVVNEASSTNDTVSLIEMNLFIKLG